MSDVGEDYKIMNEMKKERHARWHKENREVIDESKIPYTDKGEALLFREVGKMKADFYPSTGRWKHTVDGRAVVKSGGAKNFLDWYTTNP